MATFENLRVGPPTPRRLGDVLADIQAGRWRTPIADLRQTLKHTPDAYPRAKELLPTFFPSGHARSRKVMVTHSGLVQIDADHCGARLAAIRLAVVHDAHVAAAFTSPSGDRLKVLVHVGPIASEAEHAAAYAAADSHIARITGHAPDPSCKNWNRHCFVSHDPDLFANGTAVPLVSHGTHQHPLFSSSVKDVSHVSCKDVSHPQRLSPLRFRNTARGQTNRNLFAMASALRNHEHRSGLTLSDAEVEHVFWSWWNISLNHVDKSESSDRYLLRWRISWRNARPGMGSLDRAIAAVTAQNISDPMTRLLALCRELESYSTNGVFNLDCRRAGEFIGMNFRTVNRWMNQSCGLEKLLVGKFRGKSNEWRFSDSIAALPTVSTAP